MSGEVQSDAVSFGPVPSGQQPVNAASQAPSDAGGGGSIVIHGSSHVHVGSCITLGGGRRMERRPPPPAATPDMIALFRCGSVVTERQALTASRYIGVTWRDLARRLGFLGAETDDFEYRADSLKEVSFRLLQAWREKESSGATVERLAKALWDEEAYDAVLKLAELSAAEH